MLSEDDEGGGIEDRAIVASGYFDGVFVAGKVDGWSKDELSHFGGKWISAVVNINGLAIESAGDASLIQRIASAVARALGGHNHLVVAGFRGFHLPTDDGGLLVDRSDLAVGAKGGAFNGIGGSDPIGDGDLNADFVGSRIGEWDVVLAIAIGGWGAIGPSMSDDLGVVWASWLGAADWLGTARFLRAALSGAGGGLGAGWGGSAGGFGVCFTTAGGEA